eukprot:2739088-Alexandrium_andersonii.AAC.1
MCIRDSAEGLGIASIALDIGLSAGLRVYADSSAAIGICRRTGIGRLRHLAVGQLWVQERARAGDFELIKWPGADNPADMLTKA